jgi:hypothetical protein
MLGQDATSQDRDAETDGGDSDRESSHDVFSCRVRVWRSRIGI